MPEQKFLIADIGGTNIRFAWFEGDPRQRRDETTYRIDPKTNHPYEILPTLREYLARVNQPFAAACLGLAGQVEEDHVQITNRPDRVYRRDLAASLSLPESRVMLINDMPPHLAGVDLLLPSEVVEIHPGRPDPRGSRAVLMPGTGVGVGASVMVPGKPHQPIASEGGHIDFAPRDEQQYQLLQFLRPMAERQQQNHVSNEFVFCGEGLRRIFGFLQNSKSTDFTAVPTSEEITAAAAQSDLPADDLRRRTVELYVKILGAAAGNLALLFAATGGLYLGGSICLSLRKFLTTPLFLNEFLTSGPATHRPILDCICVKLINYKDSGLLGAGALAKQLLA
jgi:glucokinase